MRLPHPQYRSQRRPRTRMLSRLRPLLHYFSRHSDRARRDLAQARGQHVRARSSAIAEFPLDAFVCDEEEGGAGCGSDDGAADAVVDAAETARGPEAGAGLETGFERVEGEE